MALLLFWYFAIPLMMRVRLVQQELIYGTAISQLSLMSDDLTRPEHYGLHNTRNFYLQHDNGCKIGLWHVLPGTYRQDTIAEEKYASLLSDGAPVILYLHGSSVSRASKPAQYKQLAEEGNYHVIVVDYRGFGDSEGSPSEVNMLEDTLLVWKWVTSHTRADRVFVWGHSLGSAAATQLVEQLSLVGSSPAGMILDAAFTSMSEAIYYHPFGLPHRALLVHWLFKRFVIDNFGEKHRSVERISNIECPILIMHGRGDVVIPYHLGKDMFRTAVSSRTPENRDTLRFSDCGDTGHSDNYASDHCKASLDGFIQDYSTYAFH